MRSLITAAAVVAIAASAQAATITGEYLESRTCEVYTGPCFANAEINIAGKEAVLAWKVDEGTWNDVSLDGLGVALVVQAEGTLGYDGVFKMNAGKIESVIIVDEKADAAQKEALVDFVRDSAKELATNVVRVEAAPITLKNEHLDGVGVFSAGDLAKIETRKLADSDCTCTNEIVYYQPLTDVENFSPAYSKTMGYVGEGLGEKFTVNNKRSAFLATFRK